MKHTLYSPYAKERQTLYLSLDRMAELMDRCLQLTFDTTVGFFTRQWDTIYEADREVYYDFFLNMPTDCCLAQIRI